MCDEKHTEKIGPFILLNTIGQGTTGKVKLAKHHKTKQKVAIKIICKDILVTKPEMRRKVEREIALLKLLRHPHVVRLYDVFQSKKFIFIVMEYVPGGELFDYILKKGKLTVEEAFGIFKQITLGLEYCHNHLVCHRDLKPENLLLDNNKNIKIVDFGMASLIVNGELKQSFCGSPHYAAPEIISGIPYNGMASDVWSLGVILFAICSGRLPFDHEKNVGLFLKIKRNQYVMPQYFSPDLQDLIRRFLVLDPTKRINIKEIKLHPWWKKMKKLLKKKEKGKEKEKSENSSLKVVENGKISNKTNIENEKEKNIESINEEINKENEKNEKEIKEKIEKEVKAAKKKKDKETSKKYTMPEIISIKNNEIDEEIFQEIINMGWKNQTVLKECLEKDEINVETIIYRLLAKRKLEYGTVKVNETFSDLSQSISVSPGNHLYGKMDSAEILKQQLDEVEKNSNLEKKKEKQSFSFFGFWKKKKEKRQSFSIQTLKSQNQIFQEIRRAFKSLKMNFKDTQWDPENSKIKAIISTSNNAKLKFNVILTPLGGDKNQNNGYLVTFSSMKNSSIDRYRILFSILKNELEM